MLNGQNTMIRLKCSKSVIEVVREVVVECLDAGGLWNIDDLDFCVECRHNTQMPALAEQQFLIAYDQLLQ